MYSLNKIVGWLVSPIGGAIVGGLIAYVCARLGRKRLAKWIGGLTVAWLWVWMTPIMTHIVGAPLESEFLVDGKVPAVETFPAADAIVLLGGSMGAETNLSQYAEMWTSADRVWQASRLYKAEKAERIIATGNGAVNSTLGLLLDLGVAKDDVRFLDARNTEEEAKAVGKLVSEGVWELSRVEPPITNHESRTTNHQPRATNHEPRATILLVTSAWHMKRARMMFRMYAPEIEVVCAPADFENTMAAAHGFSIVPDFGVFALNSVAFHEWIGYWAYRLLR